MRRLKIQAIGIGVALVLAGTAWSVEAQARRERHPVLANSARQLEGIRDRLQQAPTDFGGHKAAAIESINHAMDELRQAIAYDNK